MPFSQGDGISFFGALNMSNLYCCESCEFFSDCKGNRQKCVKQTFDEVLSTLSLREAQLLKYLYGYDGVKHTLADANREMRVVGESLQQVKARAGRKLRHPSRSKRLKEFFYIVFHHSLTDFYALLTMDIFGMKKDYPSVYFAKKGVNFDTIEKVYNETGKSETDIIKEVNTLLTDISQFEKYALLLKNAGIDTLNELLNSDRRFLYAKAFEYKEYLVCELQAVLNNLGYRIKGKEDLLFIDNVIAELVEQKLNSAQGNIFETVELDNLTCDDYVQHRLKKQEFERYCHLIKNIVVIVLKEQLKERRQSGYLLLDSIEDRGFMSISSMVAKLQEQGFNLTEEDILETQGNIKDAPIEVLDLSVRAYNCLKRANCNTVSEIRKMPKDKMRAIRNLGNNAFDEIQNKLAVFDCVATEKVFFNEYVERCGIPDSFNDLDLPEIIVARFLRVGIYSPQEMVRLSKADILAIRGMSETDIPIIEEVIGKFGLKLS